MLWRHLLNLTQEFDEITSGGAFETPVMPMAEPFGLVDLRHPLDHLQQYLIRQILRRHARLKNKIMRPVLRIDASKGATNLVH